MAGSAFFPQPADQPYFRLNFAAVDDDDIRRGVAILGRLLHEQVATLKNLADTPP